MKEYLRQFSSVHWGSRVQETAELRGHKLERLFGQMVVVIDPKQVRRYYCSRCKGYIRVDSKNIRRCDPK